MKKTRILALILSLALAVCAFAACGEEDDDTIIMGTNLGFEPFEYADENNQPAGFDVDLSELIAEKAGKTLQVEDMDFDGLLGALQSGKLDFVAAGMTIDEDRKKNADFSDPYYTSHQVIVVPVDSNIKTKEDLLGKIVAVQDGTTGDTMVRDFKEKEHNEPQSNTVSFKQASDVSLEVLHNRADAFVLDEEPSKALVARSDGRLRILDVEFGVEEYAIAVKKGNTELLNTINETLTEIKENGTYDDLIAKYFTNEE